MENNIKFDRHYVGYAVCALVVLVNIIHVWPLIDGIGPRLYKDYWFDWLFFNRLLVVLLPIYSMILAAQYTKIKIIDISLFILPVVIWFALIFLGGSGANHLIVNPAMIGCVSGLYLLRYFIPKLKEIKFGKALLLWLVVFLICAIIHVSFGTLPE